MMRCDSIAAGAPPEAATAVRCTDSRMAIARSPRAPAAHDGSAAMARSVTSTHDGMAERAGSGND
jgi:hypothetical protein